MSETNIKEKLLGLSDEERRKLFPNFDSAMFTKLLQMNCSLLPMNLAAMYMTTIWKQLL